VGFVLGINLQLYLKVWYIISEKKKGSNMMHYRELGQTGMRVSEISFGSWAIGSDWGPVDDKESITTLRTAKDLCSYQGRASSITPYC